MHLILFIDNLEKAVHFRILYAKKYACLRKYTTAGGDGGDGGD